MKQDGKVLPPMRAQAQKTDAARVICNSTHPLAPRASEHPISRRPPAPLKDIIQESDQGDRSPDTFEALTHAHTPG
eukprot:1159742-Pelagomonas_calceolata.AAC.6